MSVTDCRCNARFVLARGLGCYGGAVGGCWGLLCCLQRGSGLACGCLGGGASWIGPLRKDDRSRWTMFCPVCLPCVGGGAFFPPMSKLGGSIHVTTYVPAEVEKCEPGGFPGSSTDVVTKGAVPSNGKIDCGRSSGPTTSNDDEPPEGGPSGITSDGRRCREETSAAARATQRDFNTLRATVTKRHR